MVVEDCGRGCDESGSAHTAYRGIGCHGMAGCGHAEPSSVLRAVITRREARILLERARKVALVIEAATKTSSPVCRRANLAHRLGGRRMAQHRALSVAVWTPPVGATLLFASIFRPGSTELIATVPPARPPSDSGPTTRQDGRYHRRSPAQTRFAGHSRPGTVPPRSAEVGSIHRPPPAP